MLNIGTRSIAALRLGEREIKKAFLGDKLVFDSAPPVPTYTISAAIDPSGSGTVTGAGQYQEGAAVTLVAAAGDGYEFSGWQEGGQTVSTDNPYTFTAAGDRSLTAAFAVVSRLPDGYTEVEYIFIGDWAYIPSGVQTTLSSEIIMDIMPKVDPDNYSRCVFLGSPPSTIGLQVRSSSSLMYWAGLPNGESVGYAVKKDYRISVDMNLLKKLLTIGEEQFNISVYLTSTEGQELNFGYSNGYTMRSLQMNIYSCMIFVDGIKKGEFVPCISGENIPGLYNLVDNTFHTSGSGTITAGPTV